MPKTREADAPTRPELIVGRCGEDDLEDWDGYVAGHPQATIFHETAWSRIVQGTFRHPEEHLIAREGGRVVGVLPLFRVSSMFFGTTLVSVPFGVYGGLLVDDGAVAEAMVAAVRDLGRERSARYVELRHLHRPEIDLPSVELYSTFIAEVPEDPADALARLPRKARAEVRKCLEADDLTAEEETITLEEFHRLFSMNKRKLGSPLFPSSLFWHVRHVLGDRARILVVRHRGEVVSAVLSFVHRDTVMPYYSGAVPGAERLRANNFMYFKLMEWASRAGLRSFDFGRSRADTGSFTFKKNQGFEPKPLSYDYVLLGDSEVPALNASNPKYELAKSVFRRMPLWMAQKVGSWLVKRAPF